jgi:glycerol uptake facilitator-like aquaporin
VATILATLRFRPEAVAYMVGLYITAGYWFTASTSFANPAVTIAPARRGKGRIASLRNPFRNAAGRDGSASQNG